MNVVIPRSRKSLIISWIIRALCILLLSCKSKSLRKIMKLFSCIDVFTLLIVFCNFFPLLLSLFGKYSIKRISKKFSPSPSWDIECSSEPILNPWRTQLSNFEIVTFNFWKKTKLKLFAIFRLVICRSSSIMTLIWSFGTSYDLLDHGVSLSEKLPKQNLSKQFWHYRFRRDY